jgi:hypothetical protein
VQLLDVLKMQIKILACFGLAEVKTNKNRRLIENDAWFWEKRLEFTPDNFQSFQLHEIFQVRKVQKIQTTMLNFQSF